MPKQPSPCPACNKKPLECICPPGERWIPLWNEKRGEARLFIHITEGGFVDVRVFPGVGVDKILGEESKTIRDWAERVYRDQPARMGDLLAEFDARQRAGESFGDLAKAANRRIAGLLDRWNRGDLTDGEALTFAWHDLRRLGIGDESATEIVKGLMADVQRGEAPFHDDYPVDYETVQKAVNGWRKHPRP